MVLINIDHLSDSELAYIAQQENLDDWENFSRQELIEALEDLYGDEDKSNSTTDRKFVKSLIDVDSDVLQFPGVDPLPKSFNKNEIHLIMKDADWAYVFWGLDLNTTTRLQEENSILILRTIALKTGKESQQEYDVEVNNSDTNWNIEFPWKNRTYVIQLILKTNGREEIIAVSEKEFVADIFFDSEFNRSKFIDKYKVLVSSLVSKEGQCVEVEQVKRILNVANGVSK